jgi:hypothetical protein
MEKNLYGDGSAAISYFDYIYRPVCPLLKAKEHNGYFEFAGLTRADLLIITTPPLFSVIQDGTWQDEFSVSWD